MAHNKSIQCRLKDENFPPFILKSSFVGAHPFLACKKRTQRCSAKSRSSVVGVQFRVYYYVCLMPFLGALKLHKTNAITVNYSHRRPRVRSGNNFYRCRQQCFRQARKAALTSKCDESPRPQASGVCVGGAH
jgi:hypothetical protein